MVNTLNEILLKKNVTKTDSEFMKKNIYIIMGIFLIKIRSCNIMISFKATLPII